VHTLPKGGTVHIESSPTSKYLSIFWPDDNTYQILDKSQWKVRYSNGLKGLNLLKAVDQGFAKSFAWTTKKDCYAILQLSESTEPGNRVLNVYKLKDCFRTDNN
jgi:hypothetical protein